LDSRRDKQRKARVNRIRGDVEEPVVPEKKVRQPVARPPRRTCKICGWESRGDYCHEHSWVAGQ